MPTPLIPAISGWWSACLQQARQRDRKADIKPFANAGLPMSALFQLVTETLNERQRAYRRLLS